MESKIYKKIMAAADSSENADNAATSGIEITGLSGAEHYAVDVPTIPYLLT